MNKPFFPNDPYLMMRWSDLETAWRMLATPDKLSQVEETLEAVHTLSQSVGPEKVVFSMIAATAWLTDDGTVFKKD
jgi:hypothetical protein